MRKTFLFLLLILCAYYGKQGYDLLSDELTVSNFDQGCLSDIASEVVAIRLDTPANTPLLDVRRVRRDGDNLFLLSGRQLYRFDMKGKFLNRIVLPRTSDGAPLIADYVVDSEKKQVIVVDGRKMAYYYTFDGRLSAERQFDPDHSLTHIGRLAYYDRHIWAVAEKRVIDPSCGDLPIGMERWLYKYDTVFHEVESGKAVGADLGRLSVNAYSNSEVAVCGGSVYIHSPAVRPDNLLEDTLRLLSSGQIFDRKLGYASIMPVRVSGRFMLSTYYDRYDRERSYTYCFDREEKCSYNVRGGFEDNFYHTGKVADLQALDVYNTSFYYCRSGGEVRLASTDYQANDNPVLFIVKLKTLS